MSDTYYTIAVPSEAQFKEKASKFIGFAFPVKNDTEIQENLTVLRKKYFDATHHCYAWILGADKTRYRANDDGEPAHSAGDPILGQIKSKNLTNVLIVVVRYYGGTKLGVGGLIAAYKTAAAMALDAAHIQMEYVMHRYTVHFDYALMSDIMPLMKQYECKLLTQNFDNNCVIEFDIKQQYMSACIAALKKLSGIRVEQGL